MTQQASDYNLIEICVLSRPLMLFWVLVSSRPPFDSSNYCAHSLLSMTGSGARESKRYSSRMMSDDPSIGNWQRNGPGPSNSWDNLPFHGAVFKGAVGTRESIFPIIHLDRCEMACMLSSLPWPKCHGKAIFSDSCQADSKDSEIATVYVLEN